jgi:hypothetical protein
LAKKSEEILRNAGWAEGFSKNSKFFGLLDMVQASLPYFISDRAVVMLKGRTHKRLSPRLAIWYHTTIKTRKGIARGLTRENHTKEFFEMAEHSEQIAMVGARVIRIAIYSRLPVVAFMGPALSVA